MIFFSKISVAKRGYVQKEFKLALEVLDEIPEGQIFLIPVRLDNCQVPDRFHNLHYCDLFEEDGFEQIVKAIKAEQKALDIEEPTETVGQIVRQSKMLPQIKLRSKPLDELSIDDVKKMIKKRNLFDAFHNNQSKGLQHRYEKIDELVIDHTTGLTWQQSGSRKDMSLQEAKDYVVQLNKQKYGAYNDWRLPTLEEAMSLIEPERKVEELIFLHIDPIFDQTQSHIWTADKRTDWSAWAVHFWPNPERHGTLFGNCYSAVIASSHYSVRAVR